MTLLNRRTLLAGSAGLAAAGLVVRPARADSLDDIRKNKKVRIAVAPSFTSFDPLEYIAFIENLEVLGFDTVWLSDIPLGASTDPIVALAHAAARTTKLKLGTNVVSQQKATPEGLRSHLKAEIDKWSPIIKKAGQYAD